MMADPGRDVSAVLVSLMKGVTFAETDPPLWQALLALQARVRDYVAVLGLDLILDEAEGYAYLRQRPAAEGEQAPPRLIARRQLGYHVSLLVALLRKKLAEHDAASGDARLILGRDDIVEMLRLFLPETVNQARLTDRIDQHYVDKPRLAAQIRRALQTASQVSLAELVETYPIEQGLAELITYLSLAAEDRLALIDDSAKQTVSWTDAEGVQRQATLPQVIFTRRAA